MDSSDRIIKFDLNTLSSADSIKLLNAIFQVRRTLHDEGYKTYTKKRIPDLHPNISLISQNNFRKS